MFGCRKSIELLESDKLLVCEGPEDCALVARMIAVGLVPKMDLHSMGDIGRGQGINGLQTYLEGLPGLTNFQDNIRSIGILADGDGDPDSAFDYIRTAIIEANKDAKVDGRFSIPDAAFERADDSDISTLVILSPEKDETGCLETLLLRFLCKQYPEKMRCVNALIDCAEIKEGSDGWSQSKIDKAKVRGAISILCKRNPALSLSLLWKNQPDLIPVDDDNFKSLCENLRAI